MSLLKTQVVGRICLAALVLVVGVRMWSRLASTPGHLPTPARMGDYSRNVTLAKRTCEEREYPPGFVHPVPAVVFWNVLDSFGFVPGATAWLLVLPASMLGCLWLSKSLAGGTGDRHGDLAMALAFAAVEYYLLWDLKVANINSFYLVLILLGVWCWQEDRPVWAGILLGASVALKLYSIAFLPYLFFRKAPRIGFSMLISIAVLFVGVPVLYLGWHDTLLLTRQWIDVVRSTSSPGYVYPAYKVSLSWIALVLLNPDASGGRLNLLNCSLESITWVVRIICLGWALLVLGYFAHTSVLGLSPTVKHKRLALALDSSVILLCLLPASSTLQPHHLVVLLLPAIVLTLVLFDKDFPARARAVAGLTVGMGACLTEFSPHYPLRGVGVLLTLSVYLAGIWIVRCTCCPARMEL